MEDNPSAESVPGNPGRDELGRKSITLKRSLTYVIAITSCIALLQAYLAFVYYDQYTYRENLQQQLNVIVEVTAGNSQNPLYFLDETAASEVLERLRVYPHIRHAVIVDEQQKVFAEFRNDWLSQDYLAQFLQHSLERGTPISGQGDYLQLSHPIVHDGVIIGYVYLLSDTLEADQRFNRFTLIGASIMLVALIASLLLSRHLIPIISRPILRLVSLTESVRQGKESSRRVEQSSIAELKTLNQGILGMLDNLHEREQELRSSEQRLQLALKGSGEGMWDWNIPARSTYFDQSCCEVLGFEEREVEMLDSIWSSRIHPDDVGQAKRAFINALRGNTNTCDVEYRVQSEQGEQSGWTWLHVRGSVVSWDEGGQPLRMTGTIFDITHRKHIEEEVRLYATVFNNTSDAVVILDAGFKVLAVNQAFSVISGYSAEEMLGSSNLFLQSEKIQGVSTVG